MKVLLALISLFQLGIELVDRFMKARSEARLARALEKVMKEEDTTDLNEELKK